LTIVGRKVDIVYDNADLSVVQIECEGCSPMVARPLMITERVHEKPLPIRFTLEEPDGSRVLAAAEALNKIREDERLRNLSLQAINCKTSEACQTDAAQPQELPASQKEADTQPQEQPTKQEEDESEKDDRTQRPAISFRSWKNNQGDK
jgi:hypothetical protein